LKKGFFFLPLYDRQKPPTSHKHRKPLYNTAKSTKANTSKIYRIYKHFKKSKNFFNFFLKTCRFSQNFPYRAEGQNRPTARAKAQAEKRKKPDRIPTYSLLLGGYQPLLLVGSCRIRIDALADYPSGLGECQVASAGQSRSVPVLRECTP
jgi:hypothetical protein